jgi:predicted short-subunit dehydrogenase-like oxidoreductase (DUF2520 family)
MGTAAAIQKPPKIVMIGAGNVATRLAVVLFQKGFPVLQVFSRNISHAERLASKVKAAAVCQLQNISHKGDLYIIAVPDDAIPEIVSGFSLKNKMLIHTSGMTPCKVLEPAGDKIGVLWPLQSLNRERDLDFSRVPLIVSSPNAEMREALFDLATTISDKVEVMEEEKRFLLHTLAVMANNFTNHLFTIIHQIAKQDDIDTALLKPLSEHTFDSIQEFDTAKIQTGPARRRDMQTIKRQLELLDKYPQSRSVYDVLTKSIMDFYAKDNSKEWES